MLIREIILENFMSYEYARIPLKPGLNIVCGPNGSGKSSILLAISVALGQSYTERSRKLSDLIRWGKDSARVTMVFDNTPEGGKRPVPKYNVDYFRISRYLRKDGNYWFEANFQTVNKSEVTKILREFGINPDNMLIIMHQHMMAEFGMTSTNQRLLMTEEAIGLGEYRRHVLEAQEKLTQVLSEEESVKSLLENAEQTLAYWKGEYDRYQRRKELTRKKEHLERERVWARRIKQEGIVKSWEGKIRKKGDELETLMGEIERTKAAVNSLNNSLNALRYEQRKAFYSLLALEKEKTENEVVTRVQSRTVDKIGNLTRLLSEGGDEAQIENSRKFGFILFRSSITPTSLASSLQKQREDLVSYIAELNSQIKSSEGRLKVLEERITATQSTLADLEERSDLTSKNYLDQSVREGLLSFQRERVEDEIEGLNRELTAAQRELDHLQPLLERAGPRMETQRSPLEVSDDLKLVNLQRASLGEVSEDVETMYSNYLRIFNELKERAVIVSENRESSLKEVEERKRTWRSLLQSILEEVSVTYEGFLSKIDARGSVRLIDAQDIETAGLELAVGFRGAEPVILDTYTQSGGERSSATMAFLLALQQHVKSPFRAVDEFDVHMDPRNREVISDMLLSEIGRSEGTQYVSITPGQIPMIEKDVHVITVQNVEGRSEVKVVA